MSIVPVLHAALLVPEGERTALLDRLQALGCMHVIGFDGPASVEIDARVRAAWRYLVSSPRQHHRVRQQHGFDPAALVERIEAVRDRARALDEEREALLRRIADVAPWGHFRLPDLGGHPELRFWFYRIPPARLSVLADSGHYWSLASRTLSECFAVVVSAQEPTDLPFARVHVGSRTLTQLEQRLAEIEVEIDDAEAERASLTRWTDLFARRVDRMLDDAARDHAAVAVERRGALALLTGWVPEAQARILCDWADREGVALHLRSPAPEEMPPTLLANSGLARPGEALVRFFTTPAYRAWDPSAVVMASFVFFFAMILGDAVYGGILCLALAFAWRAMGRGAAMRGQRALFAALAAGTLAWGVASGSYAGMPPPTPGLAALQIVPASDLQLMLRISLGIGLAHLILANAFAAAHLWPSTTALARIGWIAVFTAGPVWLVSHPAGLVTASVGLVLVIAFTSERRHFAVRLGEGIMALPKVVSVVGDTLSYLRLFALAIATASLAGAFNDLAGRLSHVPGTGVVFGLLVLLAGHGINLVLGIAGGVIHGLRLNYIEFFGWSLWDEGQPFIRFERREQTG